MSSFYYKLLTMPIFNACRLSQERKIQETLSIGGGIISIKLRKPTTILCVYKNTVAKNVLHKFAFENRS